MPEEDNRQTARRTRDFNLYDSPRHFRRATWSRDVEILSISKPVIDQGAKGFALTAHRCLRASRTCWRIHKAFPQQFRLRANTKRPDLAFINWGSQDGMVIIDCWPRVVH
ncbi:hypothetical protein [Paraburkholderia sp. JHI869]|uniref:hypothetical protein n=1 Tax=Paraburkholderia sp. JHI869 TaxID=3112959 RepID=UPI00319DD3E4